MKMKQLPFLVKKLHEIKNNFGRGGDICPNFD